MRRLILFEVVTDVMAMRSFETFKSAAMPEANEASRFALNSASVMFISATDASPQGANNCTNPSAPRVNQRVDINIKINDQKHDKKQKTTCQRVQLEKEGYWQDAIHTLTGNETDSMTTCEASTPAAEAMEATSTFSVFAS